MNAFWLDVTNFFGTTLKNITFRDIADVIIVAVIFYQLLKFIKRTQATQILKGIVLLVVLNFIASIFTLSTFSWLLSYVLNAGVVVLVVLFQPELRSMLERMGTNANIANITARPGLGTAEVSQYVDEITRAVLSMSRRKVGALMVFEQKTGLNDVALTGTRLDAIISGALIENIFEPNTPLHDGAVVIQDGHIAAAGCFLKLTEAPLSRELGTRHRAALGVSEVSDCISLIVSEETGVISYARAGRMTRYLDEESLRKLLTEALTAEEMQAPALISGIFKKGGRTNG